MWGLLLYMIFLLFVLADVLICPAPYIRLANGMALMAILAVEIVGRSVGTISIEQQAPTTVSFLNSWLGDTAQTFIKTLDTTALSILITSCGQTVMRPHSCVFIKVPCTASECLFKYKQEKRDYMREGKARLDLLGLSCRLMLGASRQQIMRAQSATRIRVAQLAPSKSRERLADFRASFRRSKTKVASEPPDSIAVVNHQ